MVPSDFAKVVPRIKMDISEVELMSHHGSSNNNIVLPRSSFYQGAYGRMFRKLPPWEPEGESEAEKLQHIHCIATNTIKAEKDDTVEVKGVYQIPAGYTYFGQFVSHDITFDSTSSLTRLNDPDKLQNFRTPRFDLDSLYGKGPIVDSLLYDDPHRTRGKEKFLIDKLERFTLKTEQKEKVLTDPNELQEEFAQMEIRKWSEEDLPRNSQERALIGDARNDENIIISQLQLAFLKFHNKQIDRFKNFEEAQQSTRWHYQWVVIHDLLKRLCGSALVDRLLRSDCPGKPNLCFYHYKERPYIPVEFSVAAYRLHSMVRPRYQLNELLKSGSLPIFIGSGNPLHDLRGFRKLPPKWTVQWDAFIHFEGQSYPQLSRPIDTTLARPLLKGHLKFLNDKVPDVVGVDDNENLYKKSLAFRNILRGWQMGLPSGQDVARRMGIEPLNERSDPLWVYIMKEAEKLGNNQEQLLGPVGARIVSEVLIGLLAGDPQSYYSVNPMWMPEKGKYYKLKDFLVEADVPRTRRCIERIFNRNE
ncbi:MAG: heme peroxidase family protein [Chloroflexota bacterium]